MHYTKLTLKNTDKNQVFKQGAGQAKNHTSTYEKYINMQSKLSKKEMTYIQDHVIHKSDFNSLDADQTGLYNNNLLMHLLRSRAKLFTQWKSFQRRPKKINHEQYICMIAGQEEFKLVSPIFR